MDELKNKKFNIYQRVEKFACEVLIFLKSIKESTINKPLISQVTRSSTSIGANLAEADCAESGKDFFHKIAISKKEAKETMHWLKMLSVVEGSCENRIEKLAQEAKEITLILSAILKSKSKN